MFPIPQRRKLAGLSDNVDEMVTGVKADIAIKVFGEDLDTLIEKANEIVRCHNFSHTACGQVPDADVRAVGYRGAFGENLYIAGGRYGSPRVALDGWLNSPGHRENLFRPQWRAQGIAVLKLDRFGPYHKMTLWVSHFGSE